MVGRFIIEFSFRLARLRAPILRLRKGAAAAVIAALLLLPRPGHANGWEHGTVPFTALLSALSSGDPSLRARAAESLGYRGQREGVQPLLAAWTRPEPEAEVEVDFQKTESRQNFLNCGKKVDDHADAALRPF